ncbi:hypothetical protein K435DRAFT_823534 [Dendrothele bispora CBS 962.96]|uniref:FAD/NAD(P)-binding domain-containing protein n=1 Tax=Dendrothele bispora (strain CBS 962.96) TaxID=1314807 RepID=A0A4V4HBW7_DENBC|nr:hypothetical protein K435DRAFT_823534 [Dendrothele bispora CBS 962.96]
MYSEVVIIGPQPAVYLAQANLNSVLSEGSVGNSFAAGGQLTTTTDGTSSFPSFEATNFHDFPTRILGPRLTDKFYEQTPSVLTISKIDLSTLSEDEEPETADTVIVATSASAKGSGMSACAVCDGAVPILPLAIIGGGDSAAEKAACTSDLTKYGSYVYVIVCHNELCTSEPTKRQGDGKLLKNLWIRNAQADSEKDLDFNGLIYAPGHEPATAIFPHPTQEQYRRVYIVTVPGTTQTFVRGIFAAGDVHDKRYRQVITSAGSGCIAVL